MAFVLNPREVLLYLNELGYQNITTQQLKDFMKDLKKLIRYETKQSQTNTENTAHIPSHYAPTKATKAKQVAKKESIVQIQIKKSSPAHYVPSHEQNIALKKVNGLDRQLIDTGTKISTAQTENITISETTSTSATSITNSKRPRSCEPEFQRTKSKVKFKCNDLQPKASFIVPRAPTKIFRSDPVALYHKYQEQWKKHKLPGEDNHSELRWAIRERMIGQPRVVMSAAPSMETIAKRRQFMNET